MSSIYTRVHRHNCAANTPVLIVRPNTATALGTGTNSRKSLGLTRCRQISTRLLLNRLSKACLKARMVLLSCFFFVLLSLLLLLLQIIKMWSNG